MGSFLLTIDVGNTATSFGLFSLSTKVKNPAPPFVWTLATSRINSMGSLHRFLVPHLKKARVPLSAIQGGIISSVVPAVDDALNRQIRKLFHVHFPFVSNKIRSRVKILYKAPSEVGADRIVNARAAIALWKGPAIVIDFGTATTFDCVTAKGSYLGGVIAPGPVISAEALYQRTAKLPLVLLKEPASILGRNTLESIEAGLYHGYRGLVKEIVTKLKEKMGSKTKVMATGGQAHWILKGITLVDRHVPHLTLLGLFHMWHDSHEFFNLNNK